MPEEIVANPLVEIGVALVHTSPVLFVVALAIGAATHAYIRRVEAKEGYAKLKADNAALKAHAERLQTRVDSLEQQMLQWMRDAGE